MTKQKTSILETKTQAFVDALNAQGGKPLYELSYADARKVLEDAQAIEVRKLPADVEEKILPVGPGGEVSVRIYRPKGAKGLLPGGMYFHGGGWILATKNTPDRFLRHLANGADGPWLTKRAMEWFWDAYAPNKEDRKKTTASPLSATVEQLNGLPPALLIVDENDILRDEGEAYARKLIQSGVDVTAVRVLATHHDFALLNALADTPATKATVLLASQKLAEALSSATKQEIAA